MTSPVNSPKHTAIPPRPASSGDATKAAVITWCMVYCRQVGVGVWDIGGEI